MREADRRCVSYDCLDNCWNADSNANPKCTFITSAPENDDLPASTKVLTLDCPTENPKTQKNEKADNEAQTRVAESTGSREQLKETERKAMESAGDLPSVILSEANGMMDAVYRDHVHQNPGQHLKDGISDDVHWQDYWWHS